MLKVKYQVRRNHFHYQKEENSEASNRTDAEYWKVSSMKILGVTFTSELSVLEQTI